MGVSPHTTHRLSLMDLMGTVTGLNLTTRYSGILLRNWDALGSIPSSLRSLEYIVSALSTQDNCHRSDAYSNQLSEPEPLLKS